MMGTRGAITALLRLDGGYCGVVDVYTASLLV